jgi:hypothetical protein
MWCKNQKIILKRPPLQSDQSSVFHFYVTGFMFRFEKILLQ